MYIYMTFKKIVLFYLERRSTHFFWFGQSVSRRIKNEVVLLRFRSM